MATTTTEERLAAIRRHLDELESRARALPAESKARAQRHLAALNEETASARTSIEATRTRTATAVAERGHAIEDWLEQLENRVEIAGHSLAADLSDDRTSFEHAVRAELQSWDAYLDRLTTSADSQTEQIVSALRQRRDSLAHRLAEAGLAAADRWGEQKTRVVAAREELERKADELTAKLHH